MSGYQFADAVVSSDRPLPELPPAFGAAAEITIQWSGVVPNDVAWFHKWASGDDRLRLGRAGRDYVLDFPGWARFLVSEDASLVIVERPPDIPEFTIRHLLMHQVLPLLLAQRGRFVLHASAISVGDGAIGFCGPTGSGKSTLATAAVAMGASLLSDDSLVLTRDADGWLALPVYPTIRLWPPAFAVLGIRKVPDESSAHYSEKRRLMAGEGDFKFETRPRRLSRLYLVSIGTAGDAPAVTPIRRAAAAVEMAPQLFRLDVLDAGQSVRLFEALHDLVLTVPVARLHVEPGAAALRGIVEDLLYS